MGAGGQQVVHRETRDQAIAAMRNALSEFVVEGIPTTIPMHLAVFDHTQYIRGQVDTNFLENYLGK